MPEAILAAKLRYARWNEELTQQRRSRGEADAIILERAEALGGYPLPDETINLTFWSQRTRIPRPILEALVLSALREPSFSGPVHERDEPADIEAVSSGSGPWTPPPQAIRPPYSQPPRSSPHP